MNDFGPGDLMPWQDMTSAVKKLQEMEKVIARSVTDIGVAALAINQNSKAHESRIKTLEDTLVGLQRHNEHIMDVLRRRNERLTELEEKVVSLTAALDVL